MSTKVSVIMPVYNGEKYLRRAIKSILNQSFADFEFLIIDDASTDKSRDIIQSYKDPRIRFIRNNTNLKIVLTLNKALDLAQGEYIARMDCDDISLADRLAKQVAFMDSHPEIGVCGTWVKIFKYGVRKVWRYPTEPGIIKSLLLFQCPLAHPTVMLRKKILNKKLYYNPLYIYAEDYEFWTRLSKYTSIANIGEVLLEYRRHPNQVSLRHEEEQMATSDLIRKTQLLQLGIQPNDEELKLHQAICSYSFKATQSFIEQCEMWLLRLKTANNVVSDLPQSEFMQVLAERWFVICNRAANLGVWTWNRFWQSPLSSAIYLTWKQKITFALMCGINITLN